MLRDQVGLNGMNVEEWTMQFNFAAAIDTLQDAILQSRCLVGIGLDKRMDQIAFSRALYQSQRTERNSKWAHATEDTNLGGS